MPPHDDPNGSKSEPENPPKPRLAPSKTEPLRNIAENSSQPDRSLSRSPQLTSFSFLPGNVVPTRTPALVNVADFGLPSRQYTDSTTSTSENSCVPISNRSSLANPFHQPLRSQSSLDHQLQTAKQATQTQNTLFENLRLTLRNVPSPHQDQRPRIPADKDLQEIRELQQGLSWRIRTYNEAAARSNITRIVVVLHDCGGVDNSLKSWVKQHLTHSETAFIFLDGTHRTYAGSSSQTCGWADDHPDGNSYHRAVYLLLEHVISKVLIEKCNFSPCNIAILGHGCGGTVALTIGAVWETTRLGGIITIDGPLPEYIGRPTATRNPTPVLILGGRLGVITPQAEQRIKDIFLYVDTELRLGVAELELESLNNSVEIDIVKDFLAHSLRREEWETQAVMTLGG
jgi:predicted esterase